MRHNKKNSKKKNLKKERATKSSHSLDESKKQKPSFCPKETSKIISDKSTQISLEKNLDQEKVVWVFMAYAISQGWMRVNWKQAFIKWVLNERKIESKSKNNEIKSTVGFWNSDLQIKESKGDKEIAKINIREIKKRLGKNNV